MSDLIATAMDNAIAEIDRLRGINEMYEHDNAELHNINGRLQAALERIGCYEISDQLNYYNARSMIEIARAALKEETK